MIAGTTLAKPGNATLTTEPEMTVDIAMPVCVEAEPFTASGRDEPHPAPCVSHSEPRETKIKRGGARPGAGRPAGKAQTPWEAEGISRATYYRRLSPPDPAPAYVSTTPRWCVVAFFGNAEISATRELTRQGYETYLPLTAIRRRDPVVATMWHTVLVPHLSGYGFIRLTPTESRVPVTETRGVREVVLQPDGRPAVAWDAEIDEIRKGDAGRLLLPPETGPVLPVGAEVRIDAGAFLGHAGRVLECDGVRTRVEVTVFGRPTPVWLDRVVVVA